MRRFARRFTPLLAGALVLLLPGFARAADSAACAVIYVQPDSTQPPNVSGLAATDIEALTRAVADGMRPAVPRATLLLRQDVRNAISQAADQMRQAGGGGDFPPQVNQFNAASALAEWTASTRGNQTQVSLEVLDTHRSRRLFSRDLQVPDRTAASLSRILGQLGRQAGRTIAGQFHCLALSEHAVTIDFGRAEERRHPFQATVTDLTGRPVSSEEVEFKVADDSASVSPASESTRSGSARTVLEMRQPASTRLMASTKEGDAQDTATITVTGDYGLYIRGRHQLDLAALCEAKTGPMGSMFQIAQALAPLAAVSQPGESFACAGHGIEDDVLIIPALHKSGTGYSATAEWTATIDTPKVSITSSQLSVDATLDHPYTLTYTAKVTATPIDGNDHHLHVKVEGLAMQVPSKGGGGREVASFSKGSVLGAFQQLAKAAAQSGLAPTDPGDMAMLQNPATATIPPDQPQGAYFDLEFPLTLPDSGLGYLVPFEVSGSDQRGSFRYKVSGQIGLDTALPH